MDNINQPKKYFYKPQNHNITKEVKIFQAKQKVHFTNTCTKHIKTYPLWQMI